MNNEWTPFVRMYGYGFPTKSPYEYKMIDVRRGDDGDITTLDPSKMPPESNVFGWYWRPAKGADSTTPPGS